MSSHNPEADIIEEIERLELEAREIRHKIEHAKNAEDRRVMNRQLGEIRDRIDYLKRQLP